MENCFGVHILDISLNRYIFFQIQNFIEKLNFVSTPWKIKIPLGKSVGDHIWAITSPPPTDPPIYIYIYI